MGLIIFLVIGLIAGFIAAQIMGKKQDLVTNLIVGVEKNILKHEENSNHEIMARCVS